MAAAPSSPAAVQPMSASSPPPPTSISLPDTPFSGAGASAVAAVAVDDSPCNGEDDGISNPTAAGNAGEHITLAAPAIADRPPAKKRPVVASSSTAQVAADRPPAKKMRLDQSSIPPVVHPDRSSVFAPPPPAYTSLSPAAAEGNQDYWSVCIMDEILGIYGGEDLPAQANQQKTVFASHEFGAISIPSEFGGNVDMSPADAEQQMPAVASNDAVDMSAADAEQQMPVVASNDGVDMSLFLAVAPDFIPLEIQIEEQTMEAYGYEFSRYYDSGAVSPFLVTGPDYIPLEIQSEEQMVEAHRYEFPHQAYGSISSFLAANMDMEPLGGDGDGLEHFIVPIPWMPMAPGPSVFLSRVGCAVSLAVPAEAAWNMEKMKYGEGTGEGTSVDRAACAICLQDYEAGDEIVLVPCAGKHMFHKLCLSVWVARKLSCPLCRHPLSNRWTISTDGGGAPDRLATSS